MEELLNRGHEVKAIVRSPDSLPARLKNDHHDRFIVICASILELSNAEMAEHLYGCNAVASCLGHNMTFKGMFGHPRRLVVDVTRRLCAGIKANNSDEPTKFVLMNTAG